MTQVDQTFFFRAACVSNNKNRFSFIPALKFTSSLKISAKKLFSPELHWEMFCCITTCEYNSKTRFGHVTSPESKMAERGADVSTDFVSCGLYSLLYRWFSTNLEGHR